MSNISLKNNNTSLNDILGTINSLPSGAKEEQEKTIEITENGTQTVVPDNEKVLSKVTINTNIPVKEEQTKSIEITENGEIEVVPDTGKTLSKVTVVTNIESGGSVSEDIAEERSKWINRSWTEYSGNETSIGGGAFTCCSSLTSVNLPKCTSVGLSAFANCHSLISVNLPMCNYVSNSAFAYCSSLTSVNLPVCTSVRDNVFQYCSSLTSIDLPECSYVGGYAFASCSSLTSVNLPVCERISGYGTFLSCSSLTSIDLPMCSHVGSSAFYNCRSLTFLTLRYSSVVTLNNTDAFKSTPMSVSTYTGTFGSIYVPASLVDYYKSANIWSVYADRITALADIKDIDDMVILSNTTKAFEIQLTGFDMIPENVTITADDESKLSISNIQTTVDNITFDITAYDICDELNAAISLSYNGKTYTKSFKIIIAASPIGDARISTINTNEVKTVSVPWHGSKPASNLSIISSDESKISVSNVQSNVDNISFDITSYDVESEVDVTITAVHNNKTFMKTINLLVQRASTYTIENLDTDYIFVLNSNGYYESNNKGKDNTFAICKVNIDAPYDCKMYVDCINYAESNYDYGILSNLDTTLTLGQHADANCKQSFKGKQMASIQTVEYDIPTGEHFIYIKFIKDQSQSSNYDSLQFAIRFE